MIFFRKKVFLGRTMPKNSLKIYGLVRDSNPRSPAGSKMKDEQIRKMNKNCEKSGPLRVRLSTEKKKLLTVRVGLFSLREKAPTKKIATVIVGLFSLKENAPTKKLVTVIIGLFSLEKRRLKTTK